MVATIEQELARNKKRSPEELADMIRDGRWEDTTAHFLFFEPADSWSGGVNGLIDEFDGVYDALSVDVRSSFISFLVGLYLDLMSMLPRWRLAAEVDKTAREAAAGRALECIKEHNADPVAVTLRDAFETDTLLRLQAEGLAEKEATGCAAEECGKTLYEYCLNTAGVNGEFHGKGNLIERAKRYQDDPAQTMLGNDYADFLTTTLRMGFSFQTTNPPLVLMAWKSKPDFWNRRLDARMGGELKSITDEAERVMLMTMEVVERSCRLLRPHFLLSGGRTGYVCYQVNPLNHGDSGAMIAEAERVWGLFEERFRGIPNVSFKLPGTGAGLEAAKQLSSRGISLTITLSFGAFQMLEFAKVLQAGSALFNSVVVMNGRLAFPVRDELKALGVEGGEEAAKLAGVEVTRRVYRRMYRSRAEGGLGIDPAKVKILNASLRIYGTDIPDIDEIWGTGSITIFPNVRRAYDAIPRDYSSTTITEETDPAALAILTRSEIFRQAWWGSDLDKNLSPADPLDLSSGKVEQVIGWQPIADTLNQFIDAYRGTVALGSKGEKR